MASFEDFKEYKTLLFYHYVDIADVKARVESQYALCERLSLKGRLRVSPEGLNVTLDGKPDDVDEYCQEVSADELLKTSIPIHYKTGYAMESQRLPNLSVKACKEVVSLDLIPQISQQVKQTDGGIHLSPQQWHNRLIHAKDNENDDVVLIDVRNLYETRIGHFQCTDNDDENKEIIERKDPQSRKFSDFRSYVDDECENLKGKTIMAYCTGGVRCERATQYMKYKGIDNVYQLFGGVCNYMTEFPNGGLFKGKNFVYDPRISVPYANGEASKEIISKCMICDIKWDCYKAQKRCKSCRMLVLACNDCIETRSEESDNIKCEHCYLHNR